MPAPADWARRVLTLIGCPDVASKRWLWEQYDRHVMADTLADSATGADAGDRARARHAQGAGA